MLWTLGIAYDDTQVELFRQTEDRSFKWETLFRLIFFLPIFEWQHVQVVGFVMVCEEHYLYHES